MDFRPAFARLGHGDDHGVAKAKQLGQRRNGEDSGRAQGPSLRVRARARARRRGRGTSWRGVAMVRRSGEVGVMYEKSLGPQERVAVRSR